MTSTSSSTSSYSSNLNELSSFYSAFRADDTLIDIIPAFDYNHHHHHEDDHVTNLFQSTLSSTSIFGGNHPIKAGLTYTVPLWMAMVLQQRSFATIVYPTDTWYNITNLKYILSFEKTNVSLFNTIATDTMNDITRPNTSKSRRNSSTGRHHGNHDSDDEEDDDNNHNNTTMAQQQHQQQQGGNSNEYFLPSNYFELAMRFKASVSNSSTTSTTSGSTPTSTSTSNHNSTTTTMNTSSLLSNNNNIDVLTLLIQDIYDIRMDKLRQQFQTLLYDTTQHLTPATMNPTNVSNDNNNNDNHTRQSRQNTDLIINVTGIGTQELVQIQSYVIPAMNDIYYLES